jgi:hypothetical protein
MHLGIAICASSTPAVHDNDRIQNFDFLLAHARSRIDQAALAESGNNEGIVTQSLNPELQEQPK